MCPICVQEAALNKAGRFAVHRIWGKDRWTFCPMSGEPVPVTAAVDSEVA